MRDKRARADARADSLIGRVASPIAPRGDFPTAGVHPAASLSSRSVVDAERTAAPIERRAVSAAVPRRGAPVIRDGVRRRDGSTSVTSTAAPLCPVLPIAGGRGGLARAGVERFDGSNT
ncbi:hypothetical protein [Kitasatospora griseola]|uniref:hypothetical protein n=1 Tax=Kitasatospora griseola TaxID=2064 RepID=UPI00341AF672